MFISPVVLAGGTPYFPEVKRRIDLELLETRTFASRVLYVRYRVISYGTRRWMARLVKRETGAARHLSCPDVHGGESQPVAEETCASPPCPW